MKVYVSILDKEPWRAGVLSEDKGNTERVVEEERHRCQLRPHEQL